MMALWETLGQAFNRNSQRCRIPYKIKAERLKRAWQVLLLLIRIKSHRSEYSGLRAMTQIFNTPCTHSTIHCDGAGKKKQVSLFRSRFNPDLSAI